jgi:hypothetical protein
MNEKVAIELKFTKLFTQFFDPANTMNYFNQKAGGRIFRFRHEKKAANK